MEGKLIVRFDDTNPEKEKGEFEENIKADLEALGVKPHVWTHSSDHFDKCEEYARKLISDGNGFMDDSDQETMRAERMERVCTDLLLKPPSTRSHIWCFCKVHSKNRELAVEKSTSMFDKMLKGDSEAEGWCLRAKIDMSSDNGESASLRVSPDEGPSHNLDLFLYVCYIRMSVRHCYRCRRHAA